MSNATERGAAPDAEGTARTVMPGPPSQSDDGVARYTSAFVDLLEKSLEVPEHAMQALDLACGPGSATVPLLRRLPPGSRVVALSADRVELRRFHDGIPADLRASIYPRKERRDRLPFALNVFDVVWASLAGERLDPCRQALRQALRVLRPGGQLLIATPLKSTFVELARAIAPFIDQHRDHEAFRTLMSESPQLLDADGWVSDLRRCGAIELAVERRSLELTIPAPLSAQRLFFRYLLPLWIGDDPVTQANTLRLLDQAVTEPLPVRIHVGGICGRRGLADVEDSRSTP